MFSQHREDLTPPNVQETVKFDLLGDRKLQFTDVAVWYFTEEMMVLPLPSVIATGTLVRNKPILYRDVKWVGPIRKKQWGMLALGLAGSAGAVHDDRRPAKRERGAYRCAHRAGAVRNHPALDLRAGRKFLAIASDKDVICFPMDRKKKQVRKAIELMKKYCPGNHVHWEVAVPS